MEPTQVADLMTGEDCLIVGCGPSATRAPAHIYRSRWTFGCNRSTLFCEPDFAMCVEPKGDYDVWLPVENSGAFLFFTHIPGRPHGSPGMRTVRFDSRNPLAHMLGGGHEKWMVGMSPWFATIAAMLLGFERIGIIGVDLHERRFQAAGFFNAADAGMKRLVEIGKKRGQTIMNLNKESRLTMPHGRLEDIGFKSGGGTEPHEWGMP